MRRLRVHRRCARRDTLATAWTRPGVPCRQQLLPQDVDSGNVGLHGRLLPQVEHTYMHAVSMATLLGLLTAAPAPGERAPLQVPAIDSGALVARQQLHYRTMYPAKPFPRATLYYYANGVYRITSAGEDHLGLYVMRGRFDDPTYTVHYISVPSPDWGGRPAYHTLTFIDDGQRAGTFIQDAIAEEGKALDRQDGRFITLLPAVAPPP